VNSSSSDPADRAQAGDRAPVRVFISYAHDSAEHEDRVRDLSFFLRDNGIDARLDLPAAERRQDWPVWMGREVAAARYVLMVASPAYKRRAEGDAAAEEGRGVQWEAALLREEVYRDRAAALDRLVPVVLPGGSPNDLPDWLTPVSTTHYVVSGFTVVGAEKLLRLLTGQPYEPAPPPPGPTPALPPRPSGAGAPAAPVAPRAAGLAAALAAPLVTRVTVELSLDGGELMSRVSLEGTPLGARRARLPADVADVWRALELDPATAQERLTAAGRWLAAAVFDPATARRIGGLADTLSPGSRLDLDLVLDDGTVGLPLELLRLMDAAGTDLGPVATRPGVTLTAGCGTWTPPGRRRRRVR